ncbi:MAG TPA: hypothetical protein VHR72_15235 [Gemmataceae bacterium]|jgi:hypothetical protein|nr:hypothetical protein [Gemmataceae bacterium]
MVSAMTLIVTLALAAPVPKGAATDAAAFEPTGPAPHLSYLKADANGNVYVQITRMLSVHQIVNGQAVTMLEPLQEAIEIRLLKNAITTPIGEKIDPEAAYKRLRTGGYVAISSDGRPVSAGYLRTLNREVLVLSSPTPAARPEPNLKQK